MRFPRIRPYVVHAVSPEGVRTRLAAHEIVLERPQGIDLEIDLAPHPAFRGRVTFSTFRGELLLEPASADSVYLFIDAWPRGDRRRTAVRRRSRTPLSHVYQVDARGEKRPIPQRKLEIELGGGAHLDVDLAPAAPWASHIEIATRGTPLVLELNAANVVHATAAPPRGRRGAQTRARLGGS